jgi:hypothetical protein
MNKIFSYFWSTPAPLPTVEKVNVRVAPPKERVHVEYHSTDDTENEHHVQIGLVKYTTRVIVAHRPSFHDNE